MKNKVYSFLVLIVSVAVAQSAGLIGSLATRPNIDVWYRTIEKPDFTPPDWVFPVVWPILYLLMGIAAWLVWRSPRIGRRAFSSDGVSYESMLLNRRPVRNIALSIYGIHLLFNILWSFLFFEWNLIGVAFAEILVLLGLIVITTRLFYRVTPVAGYLMIPYTLWVVYASVLNGTIWWLNM